MTGITSRKEGDMNDWDEGNVIESYADEEQHYRPNGGSAKLYCDSTYYHAWMDIHSIVAETKKAVLLRFKKAYQVSDYCSNGYFSIAEDAEYWIPKKIIRSKLEYSEEDALRLGVSYSFSIHTGVLNKIVSK